MKSSKVYDPDTGTPIGYLPRWSYRPGDRLDVHVWCLLPWTADIVQLHYGDPRPDGPGLQETAITETGDSHEPIAPPTYPGSMAWAAVSAMPETVSLHAWVRPSRLPDRDAVALCAQDATETLAWGLGISPTGDWQLIANQRYVDAGTATVGDWHFVQLLSNYATASVDVSISRPDGTLISAAHIDAQWDALDRICLGGVHTSRDVLNNHPKYATFDGTLSDTCLSSRSLTHSELIKAAHGKRIKDLLGDALLASWDFPAELQSVTAGSTATGPVRLRNTPSAGMPGPSGFRDALSCHSDDLTDAEWPIATQLRLPSDIPSGVYAVRLHSERGVDRIPFIIRPSPTMHANVLLVLPTMTYLAYANEMQPVPGHYLEDVIDTARPESLDKWLSRHPEYGFSIYDCHHDGTGISYSGLKRPIPNIRPDYLHWISGEPRHLGADLFIVDWLTRTETAYDVATDHDLHEQGNSLIEDYAVILTGSHPEYYTRNMLNALETYLDHGGHLMYLGGNGFFWVTSTTHEDPFTIEVRRGPRGLPWNSPENESTHAFDGENGGFWADNGKPPNELVGISFIAMGMEKPAPGYTLNGQLTSESRWPLEGITTKTIGCRGRLLGGAAGHEIDCVDDMFPHRADITILASSSSHSSAITVVKNGNVLNESRPSTTPRSDLVLYQRPKGGLVFATGSICWCGALAESGGDPNVQRLTENVLHNFSQSIKASNTRQD